MGAEGEPQLSGAQRRLVLLLGVPGAGLALCITALATYLPVLARRFTSSRAIIGALVGGEGVIALLVPLWIGGVSDRTETRLGRRLPFLLGAAPVAALALGLLGLAPSLVVMAGEVLCFYIAYFTYYAPYRALYPDHLPASVSGRAQGIQGVFSLAGQGAALVGGGLLLEIWRPLPYLVSAAVLLLATVVLALGLPRLAPPHGAPPRPARSPPAEIWALLRDHADVRFLMIGNTLLTLAVGGLKAFVVLWLTEGLGRSMRFTAGAMAVVAATTILGAFLSGKLGDRYGPIRVMERSLAVFGLGLLVGALTRSVALLGSALPFVAFAGGAVFVLPYAALVRRMPAESHGVAAALFDMSNGLGTVLGPALTGAAIDLLHPLFPATRGYAAMWLVLSASTLLAVAMLRRARRLTTARGSPRTGADHRAAEPR